MGKVEKPTDTSFGVIGAPTLSESLAAFKNHVWRFLPDWILWPIINSIADVIFVVIDWLNSSPVEQDSKEPFGDDLLIRDDGEILIIEDAPPVEFLEKRKNG